MTTNMKPAATMPPTDIGTVQTLSEIVALRPEPGASANVIRATIGRIKGARGAAIATAADLAKRASESMLDQPDDVILTMEADAARSRLAADRLGKLLSEVEATLAPAERKEVVAALQADIDAATVTANAFCEEWAASYQPAAEAIVKLMEMEREADWQWKMAGVRRMAALASRSDWQRGELPEPGRAPHKLFFDERTGNRGFNPSEVVRLPRDARGGTRMLWNDGPPPPPPPVYAPVIVHPPLPVAPATVREVRPLDRHAERVVMAGVRGMPRQ
jgi:hypothetical protein